jgi:hypothetical protein
VGIGGQDRTCVRPSGTKGTTGWTTSRAVGLAQALVEISEPPLDEWARES